MENVVLTCSAGVTTYFIIPFGSYYGLYAEMDFPENPEFASKNTGYFIRYGDREPIGSKPRKYCGCSLASAIGLPEEAQFKSIDECKEFVSETNAARVTWTIRKDD